MYQKKKFPFGYIQDLKCRVLELPYKGKELSMIILLPDDIEDESTGLEKVTGSRLHYPCFLLLYWFFLWVCCMVGACYLSADG